MINRHKKLSSLFITIFLLLNLKVYADDTPNFRVGFIVSLTGSLAEFGVAIKNGVELAKNDYPEIDKVFKIYFEDSEYKPRIAIQNFNKLVDINKVNAIYAFGGPISDTLAPIAEKRKIPLFSTEYDPRYTKGKKYVIRFANNVSDYAKVLISKLRSEGRKKFGIVKMENQFHNSISKAFIDEVNKDEDVEIIYNFLPGQNDFRSIFPKLKKEKFDALGVYILPGGHNTFFSQARDAGLNFDKIFGTDGFESKALNNGIEDYIDGAIYSNAYVSKKFRNRYFKKFGNDDQIVQAALAYTFSILLKDLFKNERRVLSSLEFVEKFKIKRGIQSVCGTYYYKNTKSSGQYFSFPIALKAFEDREPRVKKIIYLNNSQ